MALLWLPFVVATYAVADDPDRLRWLVSATLLFSFAHQPLTLWLVYGDVAQRRARPRLVVLAPFVALLAVGIGTSIRPDVVALVAGVWNVAHTLRQRYGVSRLYGRLAGFDCSGDNRLMWSWLVLAVVAAISSTHLGEAARGAGIGRRNTTSIDILASADVLGAVLLLFALAVALVVTASWVRTEWRRPVHSPARFVYLGSTAVLFAVLAIEPVAGFVGYVGAHAAEYLLVVRWRIRGAGEKSAAGDVVGALVRRIGTDGSIALYAFAVVALIAGLHSLAGSQVVVAITLTLGALHLVFDGVIWRSPRPASPSSEPPVVDQAALHGFLQCATSVSAESRAPSSARPTHRAPCAPPQKGTDMTTVVDQAALHGFLQKLRDVGTPLVSITPVGLENATSNRRSPSIP